MSVFGFISDWMWKNNSPPICVNNRVYPLSIRIPFFSSASRWCRVCRGRRSSRSCDCVMQGSGPSSWGCFSLLETPFIRRGFLAVWVYTRGSKTFEYIVHQRTPLYLLGAYYPSGASISHTCVGSMRISKWRCKWEWDARVWMVFCRDDVFSLSTLNEGGWQLFYDWPTCQKHIHHSIILRRSKKRESIVLILV